jgi:hypothetical protein
VLDYSPHLKEEADDTRTTTRSRGTDLTLFVRAGRRTRKEVREQDERISIIIKTHQETEEILKGLALSQLRAEKEMANLRRERKLTDRALRAFINSLRRGGNESASN